MTSLSATIGTGNIAGVATAIFLGGPGALFWMWCTALVGMATKYAEAVLAVKYREKDIEGHYVGGPMYYIRNGLGPKWYWLAVLFALFGMLAGFGIGNTVQANSVASVLFKEFQIPLEWSGAVMAVMVGAVVLGGVTRIAHVAGALVPLMAMLYLVCGLVILALNAGEITSALHLVVTQAFTPTAATGGFAGATVWAALHWGVARGVFSNEAGLGSAPIAHAAARTTEPVEQGLVAMLGTFIDTIIICSITGLVIIVSGAWTSGETGAALSSLAFSSSVGGGEYIVAVGLCVFAFTTMLGWSYYGERCTQFLFGVKAKLPFRVFWVMAVYIGAVSELNFVWLLADTLNALMAIPNLLALLLLSPVVFALSREYLSREYLSKRK
jgi:AGCS family alanine or glycine:cation symporter